MAAQDLWETLIKPYNLEIVSYQDFFADNAMIDEPLLPTPVQIEKRMASAGNESDSSLSDLESDPEPVHAPSSPLSEVMSP